MSWDIFFQDIVPAGITAIATLGAAIIASGIIKKGIDARFKTYADKSHDAKDVLALAEKNVIIVAGIGDTFFREHKADLISLMRNKIRVKYLIQSYDKLKDLREYINEDTWTKEKWNEEVRVLRAFQNSYPNLFELRILDDFMTASYIGVDIMGVRLRSSLIHVMLYQYQTKARNSAITIISRRTDKKVYRYTTKSIYGMWKKAKEFRAE